LALGAVALGCESGGQGGGNGPLRVSVTESTVFSTTPNTRVDLVFVIDNWANATLYQEKLGDQIPAFVRVLQSQPHPLDLHVAIVSPDMGAPSDATSSIGCSPAGDDGAFRSAPRGTCTTSGLESGATYLSTGNGVSNFSGDLASTLECISMLGVVGCGFDQPLAALDRALGADGSPPPAANAGFLRDDAYLAIVFLADQDDCSAPRNTQLFSLEVGGSNQQNIMNALGPVDHYRCNRYGHLCKDPSGETVMPPVVPPSGATTLDLADCTSNDTPSGLLTPVSQFITDIQALKPDPDNQIFVSAIIGPTTPYGVSWLPAEGRQNVQPGELWPQVEHSCGIAGDDEVNPQATQLVTDGSMADPGVRLAQFVNSFRNNNLGSICDPSYLSTMQAIASKVGALPSPPCLTGAIQQTGNGLPDCAVTAAIVATNGALTQATYQNCALTGGAAPCWSLSPGTGTCGGQTVNIVETTPSTNGTMTCAICAPGVSGPGC
jgi:hypothetical protein